MCDGNQGNQAVLAASANKAPLMRLHTVAQRPVPAPTAAAATNIFRATPRDTRLPGRLETQGEAPSFLTRDDRIGRFLSLSAFEGIRRLSIPATMAVIQAVPGLTVNVKVAGQIATEYATPEEEAPGGDQGGPSSVPHSTCYIESTSGLTFSVQATVTSEFKLDAPYDVIVLHCYIDGSWVQGRSIFKHDINPDLPCIQELSRSIPNSDGNEKGGFVERKFTFAPVSSVEDVAGARIAQDIKTASSLGKIRVMAIIAHGIEPAKFVGPTLRGDANFELAEKSMKGKELSHGTSFPAGAVVVQPRALAFKHERKLCDFSFKYRSRSALQRELIIPPSPASTPVLDEIDGLSEQEVRHLARQMLRAKQESCRSENRASVKRERGDTDRAGPARQFKMVRLDDGKVAVDLSDD
ncbi:hypothetical protein TOPH_00949 [Tolypocladium ophioglossoides CBS 100239]|uniref:DUF7918 domain-containing protein n=1 Tax=Tolypocladium ophioglossoides (strain CBS 100239) TaxID=1163406 RepID=A0A0L0NJ73_TOLOC|nr:hypothetical protein TOPH_00949 [Tolypocladium ophioglossoides CBS 100239]